MKTTPIDVSRCREIFVCDDRGVPLVNDLGQLMRREQVVNGRWGHRRNKAKWTGSLSNGRRSTRVDGAMLWCYRIVAACAGMDVEDQCVDHKFGLEGGNDVPNLRVASRRANSQNIPPKTIGKTGYRGVALHRCGTRWTAKIQHEGRQIYLGIFKSPELAYEAYLAAKADLHAEGAVMSRYVK